MKAVVFATAVINTFSQCFNHSRNLDGFHSDIETAEVAFVTDTAQALNGDSISIYATWPDSVNVSHSGPTPNSASWDSTTEHKLFLKSEQCAEGIELFAVDSSCSDSGNGDCTETCAYQITQGNIQQCIVEIENNTHRIQLCPSQKVTESDDIAPYHGGLCQTVTFFMEHEGSASNNNNITVTLSNNLALTGATLTSLNGTCYMVYNQYVYGASSLPASSFTAQTANWSIAGVTSEPTGNGESKYTWTMSNSVDCCECEPECAEGEVPQCTYVEQTVSISDGDSTFSFTASEKTVSVTQHTFTIAPHVCLSSQISGTSCREDNTTYQEYDSVRYHALVHPGVSEDAFVVTTEIRDVSGWGKNPTESCDDTAAERAGNLAFSNNTVQADGFSHSFYVVVGGNGGYVIQCIRVVMTYVMTKRERRRRRRVLLSELVGSEGEIQKTTANNIQLEEEDKANLAFKHSCSMSLLMIVIAAIIF